jgi:RNA 2',3'-cyclic 3'-phosphodiesterase
MVHWSENRPREHSHENFPPHDLKPVRAFVAIRMSEQVEDAVAAMCDALKRPRDGIRWVPRANLHITLKFLGPSVDPHRLERLTAGLHDVAMKTAPFEVAARGLGAFPNLEHPRAIWVGLHSVELGALAARVETAGAEYGFERENRRWSGHLTIGRVRDTHHLAAGTREALNDSKDTEFGSSKIESITLYRSHLSPEGASYEALATFLFHHR